MGSDLIATLVLAIISGITIAGKGEDLEQDARAPVPKLYAADRIAAHAVTKPVESESS